MGITGLLPYLQKATKQCHISEFRGGTVAVDSYCLLHKGANACAEQLARGEDNQMYVDYCIKYAKMLLSYNIQPIMVFDGRNLPAKATTEAKRREARKKAKHRAAELLQQGRTDEARTYLKQCIDITPKMAFNLIKACRQLNVDCIVAPYESDAQLAFFNMKGIAECVITEDSDLVLFGCKKILYKLDLNGVGRLVEAEKIPIAMQIRPDQFTFEKFRFMCILSGCDYVDSLHGIGLKKAEKFLKLTAETNPEIFLDRIPRYLNMRHLVITEDYKKNVLIANATFLHQIVFDPYKKKLVHLIDPDISGTNPEYLINAGEKFDNEKAYQVALGNLNPYNFEEYDNWAPSNSMLSQYSIWTGVYRKRLRDKQERAEKYALEKIDKEKNKIKLKEMEDLEEIQKIEEDHQIDRDLSIYLRKSPIKEIQDESEKETSKPTLSPVLSKNPFIKKKNKISKFPKTFTYGTTEVKSRFFFSESIVQPEIVAKTKKEQELINILNKSNEEIEEMLKGFEDTSELAKKKESLEVIDAEKGSSEEVQLIGKEVNMVNLTETVTGEFSTSPTRNNTEVDGKNILKSCGNTSEPAKTKKWLDETDADKDSSLSGEVELIEKEIVMVDLTQKITAESLTFCGEIKTDQETKKRRLDSQTENTADVKGKDITNSTRETRGPEIKKIKLGACRTVGLNKKNINKQQTLHNFFSKLRKPE